VFCEGDQVTQLDLNSNNLVGSLPVDISLLVELATLELAGNRIGGTLQSEIVSLEALAFLQMSNNELTGRLPEELVDSGIVQLELGGNQLSGELPVGISRMNLFVLDLSGNSLGGQLPRDLSAIPFMTRFEVSNNTFTGELPEFLPPRLSEADFSNNLLTGEIPSSYVTLSSLDRLVISGNSIVGTASTGMCELDLSVFQVDCAILECSCCNCTRRLLEARTIS